MRNLLVSEALGIWERKREKSNVSLGQMAEPGGVATWWQRPGARWTPVQRRSLKGEPQAAWGGEWEPQVRSNTSLNWASACVAGSRDPCAPPHPSRSLVISQLKAAVSFGQIPATPSSVATSLLSPLHQKPKWWLSHASQRGMHLAPSTHVQKQIAVGRRGPLADKHTPSPPCPSLLRRRPGYGMSPRMSEPTGASTYLQVPFCHVQMRTP